MKHLLINIVLVFSLILTISCQNLLDQNPKDQLSSAIFWQAKNDFDMALTGCYSSLQDYKLSVNIQDLDGLSDNSVSAFEYDAERSISTQITASSHNTDSRYLSGYTRLASYNLFLKKLSDYTGSDLSANDKLYYLAQVRLLRAMEFYRLYIYYGSVPIVLEPLTLETQFVAKAPAEDVFKQIVSDCDFAITNLPNTTYWQANGHLTKAAAQLVKARAYLYAGYDQAGNAKLPELQIAADLTSSIIAFGKSQNYAGKGKGNTKFELLGDYYRGLFSNSLGQQEENKEYIFAVYFLAPSNSKLKDGANVSTMQFYWQHVHALPSLLDAYESTDGNTYKFDPANPSADLTKNRDPRMRQTVCVGSVKWEDGSENKFGNNKYPAAPYLYWKSCDIDEVKQNGGVNSEKGNIKVTSYVPIMRFAEVLLSHAEAVNEINGPTPEVYYDINLIRTRAGMPNLPDNLGKDEMRKRIRHERRIELAFEGFRYFDIKRWRIAEQVLNGVNDSWETRTFESPKNYLWPLPEYEVRINPNLKQNPDYAQ